MLSMMMNKNAFQEKRNYFQEKRNDYRVNLNILKGEAQSHLSFHRLINQGEKALVFNSLEGEELKVSIYILYYVLLMPVYVL